MGVSTEGIQCLASAGGGTATSRMAGSSIAHATNAGYAGPNGGDAGGWDSIRGTTDGDNPSTPHTPRSLSPAGARGLSAGYLLRAQSGDAVGPRGEEEEEEGLEDAVEYRLTTDQLEESASTGSGADLYLVRKLAGLQCPLHARLVGCPLGCRKLPRRSDNETATTTQPQHTVIAIAIAFVITTAAVVTAAATATSCPNKHRRSRCHRIGGRATCPPVTALPRQIPKHPCSLPSAPRFANRLESSLPCLRPPQPVSGMDDGAESFVLTRGNPDKSSVREGGGAEVEVEAPLLATAATTPM